MSRLALKTDFKDGNILYGNELNTNNKAANLAVTDNYEKILELQTLKADVSDVTTKLSTKVDTTVFNDAINSLNTTKANVSLVNTKADKSELVLKADKTEVQESLSKKADTTYVDTQLANKADKTTVDSQLANKVDKDTVGDLNDLVEGVDKTSIVNAINSVQTEKIPIATTETIGAVKPDGTTITIDVDGTIHSIGGGGSSGGTTDYNGLTNRPQINGVTLVGDKRPDELGLMSASDIESRLYMKADKSDTYNKAETEQAIANANSVKADKDYVDVQLNTKANIVDTYNKEEVDAQIDGISTTINSSLATKADKLDTYTKDEVDEKLTNAVNPKADTTYVDTQLATKADKTDTYTKDEVDDLLDNPNITGDTLPIGSVTLWSGASTPTNWLLCDGREVSRTTYSQLFEVIGTIYGEGDGSTSFNLPNYVDKFPIGAGGDVALAETGGEKEVKLTVDNIPAHEHSVGYSNSSGNGEVLLRASGYTGGTTTGSTGGGQAHNNMPPYAGSYYIIKAKQSAGVIADVVDTLESSSTTDALSANQGKVLNEKFYGKVLYENESGYYGSIELLDDVVNYKFIEVYTKQEGYANAYKSQKIFDANGKKMRIDYSTYHKDGDRVQFFGETINFSGKNITISDSFGYVLGNLNYVTVNNSIKIVKVIGYK